MLCPRWDDCAAKFMRMSGNRHCERSEAIHLFWCGGMDCFVARAPRNDVPGYVSTDSGSVAASSQTFVASSTCGRTSRRTLA